MEHISEAIKERNIILETNDPVAVEVFTAVPNFILKNPKLSVGEKFDLRNVYITCLAQ
jgi:hypothetical protein